MMMLLLYIRHTAVSSSAAVAADADAVICFEIFELLRAAADAIRYYDAASSLIA